MARSKLTVEERKQRRYEKSEEYRKKVLRFTLQFNPNTDIEARNWFEKNGKSGAYLKQLIMKDKKETIREAYWECTLFAVSSGSAIRPLLFELMNSTSSSIDEFTMSSLVVYSVRIASAVAPYLFENGCSPFLSKAYSLNLR